MKIAPTDTFRRGYGKLPAEVQQKVDRQLARMAADLRHPSLRIKKIRGAPGIWEARVDRGYRMTFAVKRDVIILRQVGPHDAVLNRP